MIETRRSLPGGHLLARNAAFNFGSRVVPILVGLIAIPVLVAGMGLERFGILALVWGGSSYFALVDLGLGQALTQAVAERLGSGRTADLGPLIWAAIWFVLSLGVATAVLLFLSAPALVTRVLNVGSELRTEAIGAFRILALAIPLIALTRLAEGLLASHQRFDTLAVIRIPMGVLRFAGPVATVWFTPSLVPAAGALMAVWLLALTCLFVAASGVRPELRCPARPGMTGLRSLLRFGGWMTVQQVLRPTMVYLDRFVIGATLNVTLLTFYVTPYEVLARVRTIPHSITGVLFPALATTSAADRERLPRLYDQMGRVLLLLVLPATCTAFLLAPEALQYWLGTDFRVASTPVAHWLAAGWTVSVLAHPATTFLKGVGRPDLLAKTSSIVVIPYLLLLVWATANFGIAGTAAGWFLLVLTDTLVLNEIVRRTSPGLSRAVRRSHLTALSLVASFALAALVQALWARVLLALSVGGVCALLVWPRIRSWIRRLEVRSAEDSS